MRVIYKYAFPIDDVFMLFNIPFDYRVLHIALQYEKPTMWIEHSIPEELVNLVDIKFRVFGTGHHFNLLRSDGEYLGTVLLYNGMQVYHIYGQRTLKL